MSDTQRQVMLVAKRCTEASIKKNDPPKGALSIAITVNGQGVVSDVGLTGFPKGMGTCMNQGLRAITFPGNGTTRFYEYPLNSDAQD